MSRAIASARQRRAGISNPEPVQIQQQQGNPNNASGGGGLTLPQVISLVDTRLIKLETFMKEVQSENKLPGSSSPSESGLNSSVVEEYNHRFEILADEIANLKDIVLKLQSYTMDVNKTLLENNLPYLNKNTNDKPLFVMQSFAEIDDDNLNVSDVDENELIMENIYLEKKNE